jgi:hypothetical protein
MCDGSLWEQQQGGGEGQTLPAIALPGLVCGQLSMVQIVVDVASAQKVAENNPV